MGFKVNRGKVILNNWDARQKELDAVVEVDADLKKAISREKYIYLRDGLARLIPDATLDERIYAGIIKTILKKLRRDFFPNPIVRTYMQWKEQLLIMPKLVKYFKDSKAKNLEMLNKRVSDMGVSGLSDYLSTKLDYESEKVELPLSSRFEQNGALEVTLSFEKHANEYQLLSLAATLRLKDGITRKCSIPEGYGLNINHAVNLLQGRAVRLARGGQGDSERWLELDFDRLDEKGRLPIREHVPEDAFSLEKVLAATAREMNYPALADPEVLHALKNGAEVCFRPEQAEAIYLSANPGERTVAFCDQKQRPIPKMKLQNYFSLNHSAARQQQVSVIKLGKNISTHQHQGLGL